MFYAHFVLAKKGPLSKIWLAAHWDKKLTKAHVFETNIETSVDGILKPKVKMALRTSGHLLLGVVRIYSRKAKYLLQDCNEAFVKIKMAFRPGVVDLPEEHREAAMNAITLPEVFHDFDTAMPELNEVDIEAQFSLNQSRAEEITMREDYGSLNLVAHDDGFGDMGFDTDNPDIMREAIGNEGGLEQSNLLFADGSSLELAHKDSVPGTSTGVVPTLAAPTHERRMEAAPHAPMDDGFGGTIGDVGDVGDFGHAGGLFEGDLFGDVTASSSTAQPLPGTSAPAQTLQAEIEAAGAQTEAMGDGAADAPDSDDDMGDHYDAGNSPHHSWVGSPAPELPPMDRGLDPAAELMPPPSVPRPPSVRPMEVDSAGGGTAEEIPEPRAATPAEQPPEHDNTTLLHNDEESFALAPVDATVLKGIPKTKRKRKLIVDEVKNISGEEMKNQLSNTSDIVSTLDLAPPTRRLMHWKETGGVEKLFALPARPIPSRVLFKKYQRNMTARSELEEADNREPDPARRARSPEAELERKRPGRKRKHEEVRSCMEYCSHLWDGSAKYQLAAMDSIERRAIRLIGNSTLVEAKLQSLEHRRKIAPPETPAPPSVAPPDMDMPTPVPQEYEPSVDQEPPMTPATPGYETPRCDPDMAPATPGMLSSIGAPMTPGTLGPLTPGTLIQGGLTPGGLQHGGLGLDLNLGTPGVLTHPGLMTPGLGLDGGLTPAGFNHGGLTPLHSGMTPQHGGMTPHHGGMTPHHGGMTPLHGGMTPHHGGMTPGGLDHGGMTPAGLQHGGMTPVGLQHGDMTPAGLQHGGMTPVGLQHGGMTPAGLQHGDFTPAGLQHGGITPTSLQHGLMMSSLEQGMLSAVNSPVDTPTHAHAHYQPPNLQMTNLGYDGGHHSPHHDYDLPPSVERTEEQEREVGETDEQFEERVLNRRATQLFTVMRPKLAAGEQLLFNDLAPRHNNRKQVAQKFYSLLVLKKHQVLKLEQAETYGPLLISKGSQFETEAI